MSSWLGNSLSSIGGQLTNLTKEVFTEGTEEVTDHATELHIATARVKELEAALVTKLYENGRLQKQVADASERAESAEMQIHGISAQYRTLLENKEKETKDLTDRVHDLEDLNSKAIMSPPNSPGSHHNQNHHGNQYQDDNRMIGHDLVEFADVITSQREINRLSQEVQRLRTECDKWRHQAAHKKGFTAAGVTSVSREELVSKQDELKHLQLHVQELQTQLDEERESSQRQLTALQDAHAIRVSQLKQRQQQPTSSSETTTEDGSQGAEQGARLDDQLRASVVERNKSEEEIRRLRQHLAQISHYIMHAKTLKEVREISSPTPGTTSPDAISLTSTPVQNTIKSRCVEEGGDLSQYYSSVEAPDTSNVTLHNLSQESQEIVEDEYSEEGGYRTRIAELEQASSEWDVEKGALEDLVVKLRRQSKEKDKHIADRMAAQGSQTMAGELAHIQTRLEASLQQVTSLQEQNFELQAKVQRIETERHTVTNDATEQREDAATSHQGTPLSTTTEDSETLAELSGTIASLQGELEALNETSLILAEEKLRYEQQVIEGAEQLARTQRRHRDEHSQSEATINALMAEKQRLEEEREHQVALQRAGEKKVARLQAELSATEGKMAELHAEGATARQEAERLRHENVSLEREAALARQNLVHQRELATDSLQGALRDNERDGREGSPGAAATSAAELADARGRCALLAQEASELDDRLREKAAENVIMEALVAERDRDATRLAATLADAETRGAEAEQERQALTTRLREQRGAAETETRRLDAELARISAVSREAEARLAESVAQNARFRSHLNDDAHQVASVRHELEEQTAQLGALKESNGRQEATLAAQAQQIAETSVANQRLLRDNVARTEETERHRTEIRSLKAAIAAREDGEKSAREERGRGSKEDEKEEGDLGDAEKKGESRTEAEKDSNMESGNDGVRHGDNNCPAPRDDANDRNFVVLNGGNESDWDAGEEGVTGGSPQREGAGGAQPGERHATNVRLREAREQLRSLHAQLSSLQAERGKLLAVLQERTRETASLRAEVHRLVDAVAAAEQ
ncbi:PREDICTED: thyroid receptor-interacting protein 11-like [Priapulus caudatus]|uniref:Thyroid receptor-interacting protein 11-like n=1 Tax=Priapulus caudatus TaxID=37621 RepID=A0ABM1DT75_PRICU|nr:PREDICTED: thyroid receptor-interacting protein 11-like [Priapulus caudatus]